MNQSVIIIGAGIIGATTALTLSRAGYQVTICDAGEPGGEQAASYGNGGWISPASIIPMSMPGLWKQIPGFLLDRSSPLTLDWKALPALTPWLSRFLLSGATKRRASRTAKQLSWLLHDAPDRHATLAESLAKRDLIVQNGLIYAYPDRQAFEAEAFSWQLRRENGVRYSEWNEAKLRERLPAIDPCYTFAVHATDGAHCANTGDYVISILDAACSNGAVYIQDNVASISGKTKPAHATLSSGVRLSADHIVLAAGIHSAKLMKGCGLSVPMTSERGYHVTLEGEDTPFDTPVMPSTGKMANTPTQMGLRLAGQVELAAIDKAPDWKRSQVLLDHALKTYPYLRGKDLSRAKLWMGHRPSPADCKPLIGNFGAEPRIIAAFGHAHTGIAAAPKTAELVQAWIEGKAPPQSEAFSPKRFGL